MAVDDLNQKCPARNWEPASQEMTAWPKIPRDMDCDMWDLVRHLPKAGHLPFPGNMFMKQSDQPCQKWAHVQRDLVKFMPRVGIRQSLEP